MAAVLRSPVLVGRQTELAVVDALLDRVAAGRGGVLVVVGEAGIGKSRLLAEAVGRAGRRGVVTAVGRAREGGGTYRAVTEALAALVRDGRLAETESVRPYRAALGRVVPGWGEPEILPAPVVDPTVVLGEGLVRLLTEAAGGAGCLLVLEDLHWADADTVALVAYLADVVAGWPVLIAAAARDDEPSPVGRLARLAGVTTLRPSRLDPAGIVLMAEQCATGVPLAPEMRQFLVDSSEGLPLLVEELLAGMVRADPPWTAADPVPVSPTLAGLVEERLGRLGQQLRRVVEAAAVLGSDIDVRMVAATAGAGGAGAEERIVEALRAASQVGLLVEADGALRWRHALTRDAVLATMFAPEYAMLARRAAAAFLDRAWPDDDRHAAELLAAAGDARPAAEIFLRRAGRELAYGALRSADDLLTRAAATRALRPAVAVKRVQLLALSGQPSAALAVGAAALDEAAGGEHVELCLQLAQAALGASRWPEAERYLERAGRPEDPRSLTLAADAAFGAGDLDRATRLARTAVDRAAEGGDGSGTDRTAIWCAALTTLGRCALRRDAAAARDAFARAAQLAAEHGLRPLRVTALMGVGSIDLFDDLTSAVLQETRELAVDTGMLAVVISIDLAEVDRIFRVDGPRAAEPAARRNADDAARLRLHRSHAMAELYVAAARVAAGDTTGAERVLDAALRRPHASAEVTGAASAVRALRHVLAHDLSSACAHLDACITALGPDGYTAPGLVWGLWALLRTVLDDHGQARERLRAAPAARLAVNRGALRYADAVAAGRAGRHHDAEALLAAGDEVLAGQHWWRRLLRLVALEAAVADGWGDPVVELRADLAAFERTDEAALARTCRDLLRRAGAPTRRGRGHAPVPAALRGVGVTTREMDVLTLLCQGLTNREIARRLFLSPRTVETHVANLLAKTGAANRSALRKLTPDTR